MIPSRDKPKYKPLVRLRADVYKTLKNKNLYKKKWRPLISFVNRSWRLKKTHRLINYRSYNLPKFPVYHRYTYQKNLFLRTHIKLLYGRIQDYKMKQIIKKKKTWFDFAQGLEQRPASFLHRLKLASSYSEARLHEKHKRIYVNGNLKVKKLKKGDVLHFSPYYEKLLKRRIITNFLNTKKFKFRYGIHSCVDFDINSMRFFFISNIKYLKNHPFKLPFIRVYRWYSRV